MRSYEDDYRNGLAHYERDELAPAAAAFERVLASVPNHVQARFKLGNVRKGQSNWEAAEFHYIEVLRREAGHAETLNNLGTVYDVRGRHSEAEACYCKAIACKPTLSEPYTNLGRLLQAQGRSSEAAEVYRRAIAQGLTSGLFEHLLDAVSGAWSAKAPPGYVRGTFDGFADQFDQHLIEELEYRVPEQLVALAREHFREHRPNTLDLGCGTGLVGAALAGNSASLVGVDLSSRMLEAAHRRGCYDELHCAEIEAWLAHAQRESFDLVIAADVLIYIGDLAALFGGVARILRAAGGFAFSVESCDDTAWRLLASGRYAHSAAYLDRLAAEQGFVVAQRVPSVIRRGSQGELLLLGKRSI
jgi:predicted TPR repeat methyltransferase